MAGDCGVLGWAVGLGTVPGLVLVEGRGFISACCCAWRPSQGGTVLESAPAVRTARMSRDSVEVIARGEAGAGVWRRD